MRKDGVDVDLGDQSLVGLIACLPKFAKGPVMWCAIFHIFDFNGEYRGIFFVSDVTQKKRREGSVECVC